MENNIEDFFYNINLSPKSLVLYSSHLRRLGITEIEQLSNTRLIEEKLSRYAPNTRRSYLIAIVVLLKNVIQRAEKYCYLYNFYKEWLSLNKSNQTFSHPDITLRFLDDSDIEQYQDVS